MAGRFGYRFPFLARQINGPIAEGFGEAIDSVYEKDAPFLDFLSHFDIENLEGKWLDMLGAVLGFPRPWITIPELVNAFQFDGATPSIVGRRHGFSDLPDTPPYLRPFDNNGGVLDDYFRDRNFLAMEDPRYQKFLRAIGKAKKTLSLESIADVMETFVNPTRYAISFIRDNDIQIAIPPTQEELEEYLETAFDSIFTTAPKISVLLDVDFDRTYTLQNVERIVAEVTESDQFTVAYSFDGNHSVFDVVLDASLSSFESAVSDALEDEYGSDDDILINVSVAAE